MSDLYIPLGLCHVNNHLLGFYGDIRFDAVGEDTARRIKVFLCSSVVREKIISWKPSAVDSSRLHTKSTGKLYPMEIF